MSHRAGAGDIYCEGVRLDAREGKIRKIMKIK